MWPHIPEEDWWDEIPIKKNSGPKTSRQSRRKHCILGRLYCSKFSVGLPFQRKLLRFLADKLWPHIPEEDWWDEIPIKKNSGPKTSRQSRRKHCILGRLYCSKFSVGLPFQRKLLRFLVCGLTFLRRTDGMKSQLKKTVVRKLHANQDASIAY